MLMFSGIKDREHWPEMGDLPRVNNENTRMMSGEVILISFFQR